MRKRPKRYIEESLCHLNNTHVGVGNKKNGKMPLLLHPSYSPNFQVNTADNHFSLWFDVLSSTIAASLATSVLFVDFSDVDYFFSNGRF